MYRPTNNNTLANSTYCDHVHGLINKDTVQQIAEFGANYRKIHPYLTISICLFGILTNASHILVFTRKHMVSSSGIIITWMSVNNVLHMVVFIPYLVYFYLVRPGSGNTSPYMFWAWYIRIYLFCLMFYDNTVWLTIVLATIRFVFMYFPTLSILYFNKRKVLLVAALIFMISLFVRLQYQVMMTIGLFDPDDRSKNVRTTPTTPEIKDENMSKITNMIPTALPTTTASSTKALHSLTPTKFYYPVFTVDSESYQYMVHTWLSMLYQKRLPAILLFVATVLLTSSLRESLYRKRIALMMTGRIPRTAKGWKEERQAILLVLVVVVLRGLVHIPLGLMTEVFQDLYPCYRRLVHSKILDFLNMLDVLSKSIEIFFYICMNKRYRETLVDIFYQALGYEGKSWDRHQMTSMAFNAQENIGPGPNDSGKERLPDNLVYSTTSGTGVRGTIYEDTALGVRPRSEATIEITDRLLSARSLTVSSKGSKKSDNSSVFSSMKQGDRASAATGTNI